MSVTVEAFTVSELTPKAADRAVEQYRHTLVEYPDWADSEVDHWTEQLKEMGFCEPEIRWSGFGCQGDGASFTCKYVDLARFIKAIGKWSKYRLLLLGEKVEQQVHLSVVDVSPDRYVHKYTVRALFDFRVACDQQRLRDRMDELAQDLEDEATEVVRDKSEEIYNALYEEYFYLISDEAVAQNIESRGLLFTAAGARIEGEEQ